MNGRRLSPRRSRRDRQPAHGLELGVKLGLVSGRFPNDGLRFAKIDEKPPFMTREEIERRIAAGRLKPYQIKELWNALSSHCPRLRNSWPMSECAPSRGSTRWSASPPIPALAAANCSASNRRCRFHRESRPHSREEAGQGQAHDAAGAAVGLPRARAKGMAGLAPRRLLA